MRDSLWLWLWLRWLLVVLFFAQGGEARPPACATSLAHLRIPEAQVAERTGGHSELTRYLTQLVNDPYVPPSTKRVIHDALMLHEVKVRELTEEVRWDLNLPGTIGTYAFNSYTESAKFEDGTSDRFLYFGTREALGKSYRQRDPQVWTQHEGMRVSPEELLVHELAHIRFMGFLDRRLNDLIQTWRLPEWAWIRIEEATGLQKDLYTYLAERFAYESQAHFVRALADAEPNAVETGHQFFGDIRRQSDEEIRARIIAHLMKEYPGARDPRLRAFDSMSMTEILSPRRPPRG